MQNIADGRGLSCMTAQYSRPHQVRCAAGNVLLLYSELLRGRILWVLSLCSAVMQNP
jgi:hypothetical protein